jgi:hypothetical protein
MVCREIVLMRGVWSCGTLYKLLGGTCIDEFNGSIVPEQRHKEDRICTILGKNTMLWHQKLEHIREKVL